MIEGKCESTRRGDYMRSDTYKSLAAVVLLVAPCFGQTFGEITGQVTDPRGGAVPGARITTTNTATNATREPVSNNAGVFGFPSLPRVYTIFA